MTDSGEGDRKEDTLLELPKPAPRNRRWTLLMVSDSGRIVRVRRVKAWITLLSALPLLAAAVVAGGYLRSERPPSRDRRLSIEIERLQGEVRRLEGENARLALLQPAPEAEALPPQTGNAETPPAPAGIPGGSGSPNPGASAGSTPIAGSHPDAPVEAPGEDAPEDPGVEEEVSGRESPRAVAPADDGAGPPVEVRHLTLDFNSDRSDVSASFNIYNRRTDGETLFGFAFVILKPEGRSAEHWLVFPETELTAQGPVSFRRGYDFSISNYMTIKFNPRPVPPGATFQTATVQVYDASGRRLLAQDFGLNDG